MSAPIPFPGTPEAAQENRLSHNWGQVDEFEFACWSCDAKPWHVAAEYPCGVEPPRTDDPAALEEWCLRFPAYAHLVRHAAGRS
jgi:hypothetical protein